MHNIDSELMTYSKNTRPDNKLKLHKIKNLDIPTIIKQPLCPWKL